MRSKWIILLSLAVSACNFADDVEFDPGDTSLIVQVSNVMVSGDPLPASVAAGSQFQITAVVNATNSSDCPGCSVQVIIGIANGESGCLIDAVPTGAAASPGMLLDAPAAPGVRELYWSAYEEADCDAALAAPASAATTLGNIDFTAP